MVETNINYLKIINTILKNSKNLNSVTTTPPF